ncbi:Glypican-1 [Aix galericulata]|nr:Glypican-1 [Aix galericulata]
MSGSGSGDSCPDDVCGKRLSKSPSTRQPETHAIPKQSGHGISGASSRSLPSAFLLFLSVAFIAVQHLWRTAGQVHRSSLSRTGGDGERLHPELCARRSHREGEASVTPIPTTYLRGRHQEDGSRLNTGYGKRLRDTFRVIATMKSPVTKA